MEEFEDIVEDLIMPNINPNADINKAIWRINEAAMYLSRFVQLDMCGHHQWLPVEAKELIPQLVTMSRSLSLTMFEFEEHLRDVDPALACLECVEDAALGVEGE